MLQVIIAVILLVLGMITAAAQTSGTGTISGTVMNDAGQPISGAKLVYARLAEYGLDRFGRMVTKDTGITKTLTTGADGTFMLSGLAAGNFDICAYGQSSQVSGCEWDEGAVIVLGSGQSIQKLTRLIHDAAIVTFKVSDPNAKISVPDILGRVQKERRFFLGVSSPSGRYHRSTLVSSSAGAPVFNIAIPKQRTVSLFIDSELTVLFNGSDQPTSNVAPGTQVETRRPSTLQISPAARDQITVNLIVP